LQRRDRPEGRPSKWRDLELLTTSIRISEGRLIEQNARRAMRWVLAQPAPGTPRSRCRLRERCVSAAALLHRLSGHRAQIIRGRDQGSAGGRRLIHEVRFAQDSPLEGTGFEPSVPPDRCRRQINPPHSNREGSSAKTNGKTVGTDRGRDGRRYAAIRDIRRVVAFQWAVWGDCPILPDSLSGGALLAMRHSAAAPLFQTRIPQNSPGCSLPFIYDVRSSTARTHRLCCRRLSYASSPV
jgi:hypothetical protein